MSTRVDAGNWPNFGASLGDAGTARPTTTSEISPILERRSAVLPANLVALTNHRDYFVTIDAV